MKLTNSFISEQNGLTHLTFNVSGDVVVSRNQAALINSLSACLLPIEITEKAGGYAITYNVGSRISLSKYFLQNKVDKATLLTILKGICTPLSLCKENRLYMENFSFDPDYIFRNSLSSELKLIYFPFETGQQAIPALKSLLSKIFHEFLNPEDSNDVEYINRITHCYNQQNFTPFMLITLIDQLEAELSNKKIRKTTKREKAKNKGFWNRLFTKKEKSILPHEPEMEPAVPLSQRMSAPIKRNGTEFLIAPDKTSFITAEEKKCMQLSISGKDMTNQVEIHRFPCILGRSPQDADIVLEDGSVSRKHAVIDWIDGVYCIIDSDSSNGVSVDGIKLSPGVPHPISTGDLIKVGRTEIRIMEIVE